VRAGKGIDRHPLSIRQPIDAGTAERAVLMHRVRNRL